MKLTPILFMERLEPSLDFWTGRIGLEVTATVPDDSGAAAFAILVKDGTELMLQSHASAAGDLASVAAICQASRAVLYLEVPDFADIERRLDGWPVAMPVRETFYGMREIGVVEPGGHLILFAAPIPK